MHYSDTLCLLNPARGVGKQNDPERCLEQLYHEYFGQLTHVGERVGPLVFNRIDLYAAEPATDNTGEAPGFYTQHVAYPAIDDAETPRARNGTWIAPKNYPITARVSKTWPIMIPITPSVTPPPA